MKLTMNPQLHGVELRFDSKPSAAVRELLRENRFRFSASGGDKRWYAKDAPANVAFAIALMDAIDGKPGRSVETPETSPPPPLDEPTGIVVTKAGAKAMATMFNSPPPGGWKPEDKVPDHLRKPAFLKFV